VLFVLVSLATLSNLFVGLKYSSFWQTGYFSVLYLFFKLRNAGLGLTGSSPSTIMLNC
jgi:hypothetical protein